MKRDTDIKSKDDLALVSFLKKYGSTVPVIPEMKARILDAIRSQQNHPVILSEPQSVKAAPINKFFVFFSAGLVLAAGLAVIISYSVIRNMNHQAANQHVQGFIEVAWSETVEAEDSDWDSAVDDYLGY